MYSSVIDVAYDPAKEQELVAFCGEITGELAQLRGIYQFMVIKTGDGKAVTIVEYDTEDDWNAAAPRARELLGRLASLCTAPPVRAGGSVQFRDNY